ncbi:MAG: hypothetical protein ACPG4J_07820, partial [Lentibacter algarum]
MCGFAKIVQVVRSKSQNVIKHYIAGIALAMMQSFQENRGFLREYEWVVFCLYFRLFGLLGLKSLKSGLNLIPALTRKSVFPQD